MSILELHFAGYLYLLKWNITKFILRYSVQWHLVHAQCCVTITSIEFRNTLVQYLKEIQNPLSEQSFPISSFFQVLATTNLLSVSVDLSIQDMTFKQKHLLRGFVFGFFVFSMMFQKFMYLAVCVCTSLLLKTE